MMSTNSSDAIGNKPGVANPKSKLDTLSKEDLIRFVKKQLDHVRHSKEEIASLHNQLNEREICDSSRLKELLELRNEKLALCKRIEELEEKLYVNQASVNDGSNATANELALRAKCAELQADVERLTSDNHSVETMKRELQDAIAMRDTLSSQLENARQETSVLKEKRAAVDVFSLELKDYEKKVDHLQKSLSSSNAALSIAISERNEMEKQLNIRKEFEATTNREELRLRDECDQFKKELCEERMRSVETSTELAQLQKKVGKIMDGQNCERMEVTRKLANSQQRVLILEDAVEALREENNLLRHDCETANARAASIAGEYDVFKSRARFVLEQKAKCEENDEKKEKDVKTEQTIKELQESIEQMRSYQKTCHEDLAYLRERNTLLENEARMYKRTADEAQIALSKTMDESLECQTSFDKCVEECSVLKSLLAATEKKSEEFARTNKELEQLLVNERNRMSTTESQLLAKLEEERNRYDEAKRQLDESRRERSRPPPIAAVFPQFSEKDRSADQIVNYQPSSRLSEHTLSDDKQDRSLEEVLFGEDCSSYNFVDDSTSLSAEEAISELNRLRQHVQHMRDLLNEAETANGRFSEQNHLLKAEIRRLERNEERRSHVENTEYLKNVIIKFLTPEHVYDEKTQLIPILTTMLRLSNEEKDILHRAAEGDVSRSGGKTWSSYLRWGGYT